VQHSGALARLLNSQRAEEQLAASCPAKVKRENSGGIVESDGSEHGHFPSSLYVRDTDLNRNFQEELDSRSKQLRRRRRSTTSATTPGKSPRATPRMTPGRSSRRVVQGVSGYGRQWREERVLAGWHQELGQAFCYQLQAKIYAVDERVATEWIRKQQGGLERLVNDTLDLRFFGVDSASQAAADTLLKKVDKVSTFFPCSRYIEEEWRRWGYPSHLNEFNERIALLRLWVAGRTELANFNEKAPKMSQLIRRSRSGGLPAVCAVRKQACKIVPGAVCHHKSCQEQITYDFISGWLTRITTLIEELTNAAADWQHVGLSDHHDAVANAVRRLMELGGQLVERTSGENIEEYMVLVKDLLGLTINPNSQKWREHLHDSARTEYEELFCALFNAYFDMLRKVGWHLKPELRPESWLEKPDVRLKGGRELLEVDGQLVRRCTYDMYSTTEFMQKRKEVLLREWQFAQSLLDIAQQQQRSAIANVFSSGMLKLATNLLRDAALICEHHAGLSEYKNLCTIAPQVMRDFLLGDLAFSRRVCEHVELAAAFEVIHSKQLLQRLSEAGFRAIRVTHGARAKRLSWDQDESKPARHLFQNGSERRMIVTKPSSPFTVRQTQQRMLLIPPTVTETQVKALLQAWGARESIQGYIVLIDYELDGIDESDWAQFPTCSWADHIRMNTTTNSLVFDTIVEDGCAVVVAASAARLKACCHKLEEVAIAVRHSRAGSVKLVVEQTTGLEQTKLRRDEIHSAILNVAHSLLAHAKSATEEAAGIWEVEEDAWSTAFQYCKEVSTFNLPAHESTALRNAGLDAALSYDKYKAEMMQQEQAEILDQATAEVHLGLAAIVSLKQKAGRARKKTVEFMATQARALPKPGSKSDVHSRRFSAPNAVELGDLAGSIDLSRFVSSSDEEDEQEVKASTVPRNFMSPLDATSTKKHLSPFGPSRFEKSIKEREQNGRHILALARDGQWPDVDKLLLSEAGSCKSCRNFLALVGVVDDSFKMDSGKCAACKYDPLVMHDVKLLRDQVIGLQVENETAVAEDASSDDDDHDDGQTTFIDKFLQNDRITVFGTSSHFLEETTQSCEKVRELLQDQPVLEYDLGLKSNLKVKEAVKKELRTYELPQVFFGKDWIGGLRELQPMWQAGTLQSLIDQFIQQNREWTEVAWEELKFGSRLGSGASGTVRMAKWHGNDYAVKIFNTEDVNDFHDGDSVLFSTVLVHYTRRIPYR
jgi:hypothetical protein